MSNIEPITMYHFDPDKFEVRTELVYPDSVLNEMARRVGDKLDEEILARLGYVKPVRCASGGVRMSCTHEPPKQETVEIGEYIDGIGTVLDPDDEEMIGFLELASKRKETTK